MSPCGGGEAGADRRAFAAIARVTDNGGVRVGGLGAQGVGGGVGRAVVDDDDLARQPGGPRSTARTRASSSRTVSASL